MKLTAKLVRQLLDYNPKTGDLIWLARKGNDWQTKSFNTQFAGKVAGTLSKDGYIHVFIYGKGYRAHRIAWLHYYGRWPDGEIDHKFGIKHDNRIRRLREANRQEQSQNQAKRKDNTSGYVGVSYHYVQMKWFAQIQFEGIRYRKYLFDTPEEARDWYLNKKKQLHKFQPVLVRRKAA